MLQVSDIASYTVPPPPTRIEGRLIGEGIDFESLWLRALPVFGGEGVTFDSRTDENGRFSITPYYFISAESSKYLLLVLAPKPNTGRWTELHVVAMQEVDVRDHETTKVDIVVK